jgi:hypothetical protein
MLCILLLLCHTHAFVMRLQDTYQQLLDQLKAVPNQQTVREYARQTAEHGQVTLLAGRLAAVLAAGTKAAFVPDMASQHIEQAKTVLVRIGASY